MTTFNSNHPFAKTIASNVTQLSGALAGAQSTEGRVMVKLQDGNEYPADYLLSQLHKALFKAVKASYEREGDTSRDNASGS